MTLKNGIDALEFVLIISCLNEIKKKKGKTRNKNRRLNEIDIGIDSICISTKNQM